MVTFTRLPHDAGLPGLSPASSVLPVQRPVRSAVSCARQRGTGLFPDGDLFCTYNHPARPYYFWYRDTLKMIW
jgi:hypothetical protein